MRVIVIPEHGEPSVLRVEERPDPEPGPGEVRVDVRAAGVNFADVMARMGLYPDAPKPPVVVGYEVAGTIGALGPGVEGLAEGDRVMAGTRFGGYAEKVVVPAADAIPLAERLSFEEGAAIPVNYATAWAALMTYANLQPGERVLLHQAAGGVGIAATQIAKRRGAYVIGSASPGKHEAIRALGADETIDYNQPKWERSVGKVDVVLDALGGESLQRSYGLLRPGGRVVAFGAASMVSGDKRNVLKAAPQALRMLRGFNALKLMGDSKAVIGLNILTLWDDRGTLDPWIGPLAELIEDGTLEPVVAETVPFDRAADAHRALSERRNIGKVVLVP